MFEINGERVLAINFFSVRQFNAVVSPRLF